jgi:Response regulators consisting of a CheY-like receiver domain and a winged-helix DNA-binding domain
MVILPGHIFSDNLPDLAVLDWMIDQGFSGLEICRRVRSTAQMKSFADYFVDRPWRRI